MLNLYGREINATMFSILIQRGTGRNTESNFFVPLRKLSIVTRNIGSLVRSFFLAIALANLVSSSIFQVVTKMN